VSAFERPAGPAIDTAEGKWTTPDTPGGVSCVTPAAQIGPATGRLDDAELSRIRDEVARIRVLDLRSWGGTILGMDEQEWLRRIDEHLETSKHYMREGNELMARLDGTMERNRVAFEDLHDYIGQATTILGALVAEVRGMQRERRESARQMRAAAQEWREESRAWRSETRDWRRTLADKVDRLSPQPPPSAA
jgi:hypothetical protein